MDLIYKVVIGFDDYIFNSIVFHVLPCLSWVFPLHHSFYGIFTNCKYLFLHFVIISLGAVFIRGHICGHIV